jgi:hypothetical protein
MSPQPQTIQIFLPAGDPQGIRIAEITTRIVRVVEVPRSLLGEFLKMSEAEQVGVYFLFGEDEEAGVPRCYIGQTGSLRTRLAQHNAAKEFWNRALVAVSLTNSLTNTHASYLEWLSIRDAQSAGRYVVENGNNGARPHTPAPMQADCGEIQATISVLLATLGYPVFEPLVKPVSTAGSHGDMYFCRARGAEGRGQYTEEGFVVLKGSSGRSDVTPSFLSRSREQLLKQGVLRLDGERVRFERDYLFKTPSGASDCLTGGNTNGWLEWRRADGRTLQELERSAVVEEHDA